MNISRGGARLKAPDLPAAGEDVLLKAEGISCFGRVAWSEGRECGIEFASAIAADDVERLQSGIR